MKKYPNFIKDITIGLLITVCTGSCAIMAILFGKKSKSKPLILYGVAGILLILLAMFIFVTQDDDTLFTLGYLLMLVVEVPLPVLLLLNLPEYRRRMDLIYTVTGYQIHPEALHEDDDFDLNGHPELLRYVRASKGLYGQKGIPVLKAIYLLSHRTAPVPVPDRKPEPKTPPPAKKPTTTTPPPPPKKQPNTRLAPKKPANEKAPKE